MRLAWTLALCILAVGVTAVAAPGWFGHGKQDSGRLVADRDPGATTYYVDASRGRDSNSGTSPGAAWRSLARVGRAGLHGGDSVLLRGGQRFAGSIQLSTENLSGTSLQAPLAVRSYGGGAAMIAAPPGRDGISATDVAGIHVSGVDFVGSSPTCRIDARTGYRYGGTGIGVQVDHRGVSLDQGVSIDHVDVGGFCNGIAIGSQVEGSRISHLRITAVDAHDNASAGIWTYDPAVKRHTIGDVLVSRSRAYRNGAFGGIVLFGVNGGTVRRSVAFDNARAAEGGVGIWAFDATRILFSHNESYGNGSRSIRHDGDGFDFDRGVSNSVMAHNYSHDNGGAGFLICSCNAEHSPYYRMRNDTIRSNVSRNDGSSGQPSFWVYGGELMDGIRIAANRVASRAGDGPVVEISGCLGCDRGWRHWYVADLGRGQPFTQVLMHGNSFTGVGKKPLRVIEPGPRADLVLKDNRWRRLGGRSGRRGRETPRQRGGQPRNERF